MNMTEILQMMVEEKPIDEIKDALFEVCDSVHSSCSDECPIYCYDLTGHPNITTDCQCFKSGETMYTALLDYFNNTPSGKRVFRQQEFISWLKKKGLYNTMESGQTMEKMHNVWEEMQKDYEEFTTP